MNKIDDFKTCPFCGSEQVCIPYTLNTADGIVKCLGCRVMVGFRCDDYNDESEIREKWNRRAT